jgi:hypothetical protein
MRPIVPLLAALTLMPLARADETWLGTSDVTFRGYSTLHQFEGSVKEVPLKVKVSGENGSRVLSATSNVPVKQMSTANKDRDGNMWTMFHEAQFKAIKIEVENAKENVLKPKGAATGTMPLRLTIAGNSGALSALVTNIVETGANVSFDLAFPVSLAAFKLDPPKAIGGLFSVKDRVDVTVHVMLKKQ